MQRTIEYYFSMHSPWAYIGHVPLLELVRRFSLSVTYKPISLPKVFAETGGLPVTKRHPARLRYRMVELQRWRERRRLNFVQSSFPLRRSSLIGLSSRWQLDTIPIVFCAVLSRRFGRTNKISPTIKR
jgi:2-hydroxychromene-2-carboxylate isomerase